MFATDRSHRVTSEAGFSLLEMLVASLISILIVGGVLLMLDGIQQVYRDQQQIMDSQQSARLALERMQRDLQLAGVGLAWMLSPLPAVVPRADGGFDIHHNQGGVTAVLVEDMSDPTRHFAVDDVSGFEIGMVVAVYDSSGTMDLVTLTDIKTDERQHLHHDGASKAYTVSTGTSVARVLTISYWVDTVDVLSSLMRKEDDDQAQPVAHFVRSLNVGYYNDAQPPQLFTPMTIADQLRIRMVEVQLTVEVENTRLTVGDRPAVTLTSRVTPRAMMLH